MEKVGPTTTKTNDKPEPKDLRSNPPTKVKLPPINKPSPPPVKDKPNKVLPKTNGDVATVPPKQPEEKETDEFDGLVLPTEKLSHPTANRAKPPQRRPPSGLPIAAQSNTDQIDAEPTPKKFETEILAGLQKTTENLLPTPPKPDLRPKTPPPVRPTPPKVLVDNKTVTFKDEPTVESLQAEIKELRMTLELLEKRQERDMQEVKEELRDERNKRLALQEEVQSLRMKQ